MLAALRCALEIEREKDAFLDHLHHLLKMYEFYQMLLNAL